MRTLLATMAIAGLLAGLAGLAGQAAADDSRDIQAAVDGYLADAGPGADLVGGPGCAGYDAGFWIRGGDFSLKINLTLQARYESMDWDEDAPPENFVGEGSGGDLSGFSLPRATLKLSGTAPCNICYYMELEFGHFGRDTLELPTIIKQKRHSGNLGPEYHSENYDNTREAWIEWCKCPSFNVRMGQIGLPTTRQMLVAPELQQFVDVSLASSYLGLLLPGYTDRNRDHGVMLHGAFGCNEEWSYMLAVTNGDGGDSIRNVLDVRTSDNLAFSGRLNWAFLKPIGYQEGALNQQTCAWYGELGAWAFYYADRVDKPHTSWGDYFIWGVDLALGYGGFSLTGAYTGGTSKDSDLVFEYDYMAWLVQLGYHVPGTAWEIAARYSTYATDSDFGGLTSTSGALEYAFGVNYYLNGHGNKLQLDVTVLKATDDDEGWLIPNLYAGWPFMLQNPDDPFGMLIRFQWQLAL